MIAGGKPAADILHTGKAGASDNSEASGKNILRTGKSQYAESH